eukprot:663375-Lingulodinium_polyedra.AAC.1
MATVEPAEAEGTAAEGTSLAGIGGCLTRTHLRRAQRRIVCSAARAKIEALQAELRRVCEQRDGRDHRRAQRGDLTRRDAQHSPRCAVAAHRAEPPPAWAGAEWAGWQALLRRRWGADEWLRSAAGRDDDEHEAGMDALRCCIAEAQHVAEMR